MKPCLPVVILTAIMFLTTGCGTDGVIQRMHFEEDRYYSLNDLNDLQRQEISAEVRRVTSAPITRLVLHGESLRVTTGSPENPTEGQVFTLTLVNSHWQLAGKN